MDGPDIDLVSYCGLPDLSDHENDLLWGQTSPISLLEACPSAFLDWQDEDEAIDVPLYTDRTFKVFTNSEESLQREIRDQIRDYLGA